MSKSYHIWPSSFRQTQSLTCSKGALVFVVLPVQQSGSKSVLLQVDSEYGVEEAVAELVNHMKSIGCNDKTEGLEIRVVGQKATVDRLENRLRGLGFQISKSVVKGEPFEAFYYGAEGRLRVSKEVSPKGGVVTDAKKVKVLVVDDSETMRRILSRMLIEHNDIEILGAIGDPRQVESFIGKNRPDVVTVDLHMPGMSGVELIRDLRPKFHLPMVVVSSLGLKEGSMVMDALEAGAVDYLQKPDSEGFESFKTEIHDKIIAAAGASLQSLSQRTPMRKNFATGEVDTSRVIAIGSSTGGTEAIKVVLSHLPKEIPPIVIVQHIPPVFSEAFAQRLDRIFDYNVKEARDGDILRPNCVFVAPGGTQMRVKRRGHDVVIEIGPPDSTYRHSPSVDVLFDSVAEIYGNRALAAILTGMGRDGTDGLLRLKSQGALTVGQDEASCVVYGMPRVAFESGAVAIQRPLEDIGDQLVSWLEKKRSA